jgi:flagellar motor component MotA
MLSDLYYNPKQQYKFKLGTRIASALLGFIAGFIVAALVMVPLILWMR